jgi:hypothetical protein
MLLPVAAVQRYEDDATTTVTAAWSGKLTLRSALGEGTSLVIELPLEPAGS